jgi:hypothetical protein
MTAFTPDTGKVFWVEMLSSFRQNLKSQFSFVRFYSERKKKLHWNFKTSLHCLTGICCKRITFVYSFGVRVLLLFKHSMLAISSICIDFPFYTVHKMSYSAGAIQKKKKTSISYHYSRWCCIWLEMYGGISILVQLDFHVLLRINQLK